MQTTTTACRAGIMLSEVNFPNFPVMLRNAGYDFFIIDCEHGPFDFREVAGLVAMARRCGIEAVVRVPGVERAAITKYLDLGADGLLIPMVRDAADARRVIELAKYDPIGRRGVSISRAHSDYAPGELGAYMARANMHMRIYVQIELCSALAEVEAIAAVPGVSALMVGPSDLAMDMGVFPSQTDPLLLDAAARVAKAAAAQGLTSGVITANPSLIAAARTVGMTEICCGSELRLLTEGLRENKKTIFLEN